MKRIVIRPYKNVDYSPVILILQEGDLYYESTDTQERLAEKVKRDPGSIMVATLDQEVIGTVSIMEDGRMAFIFRLGVKGEHRRQGIGTKLMEEAERLLRNRDHEKIHILVKEEDEELQGYYDRHGYKEGGHYRWRYKELG